MTKRDIGFLYVWGGALFYLICHNPLALRIAEIFDLERDPYTLGEHVAVWTTFGVIGLWFWYWPKGRDKRRASLKTPQ